MHCCIGFSLVVANGGYSPDASHCGGSSCFRAWALGMQASVVAARWLSCSTAWGIFPDQGSNS